MSVLSHTGIVTRDSVEKTKENVNNRDVLLGFTDWAVESGFGVQWGKNPPPPPPLARADRLKTFTINRKDQL